MSGVERNSQLLSPSLRYDTTGQRLPRGNASLVGSAFHSVGHGTTNMPRLRRFGFAPFARYAVYLIRPSQDRCDFIELQGVRFETMGLLVKFRNFGA